MKNSIDFTNVKFLSADTNYTKLHFADGRVQIEPITLKLFENYLLNNQKFIRIHRSFLVNREYVKYYSDIEIGLKCGCNLPVSRRRKKVF